MALSPTETRIVALVAKGLMDKEIARELGINPATVKNHLTHIRIKLGTITRIEIALLAVSMGLVDGHEIPVLSSRIKWILGRVRDIRDELNELEKELEGFIAGETTPGAE